MSKARLTQIGKDLGIGKPAPATAPVQPGSSRLEANPERGSRSHFLKVTITLPPDLMRTVSEIGLARRATGAKNTGLSELIREALVEWVGEQAGR
jgi:hypothetical protein